MKKISVIIPCYNVSSYIDRCMRSITGQTIGMDKLELICVDDASTDDTWEYLQKWEQLSFVDADDWLEPDYFERLYAPAIGGRYDVVCCGFIRDASEKESRLEDCGG